MNVKPRTLEIIGKTVDPNAGVNGIAGNTSLALTSGVFALRTVSSSTGFEYVGLQFDLSYEPLGLIAVRAGLGEDMDYIRLMQDTLECVVSDGELGKPHEVTYRGLLTPEEAVARLSNLNTEES